MVNHADLPISLGDDPIVDAFCEIQLVSIAKFSQLMPGLLYAKLEGNKEVIQAAGAMIPPEVVQADPNLRFVPLSALNWNGYIISFSDHSLLIQCKMPYPRWKEFRQAIHTVVHLILDSHIVSEINRFSLKYVDLIASDSDTDRVRNTSVNLSIGKFSLENQNFQTHLEVKDESSSNIHLIHIASPAHQKNEKGDIIKTGTLITTDSIRYCSERASVSEFKGYFESELDALHVENKNVFFECLSPTGLQLLRPNYA